MQLSRFLEDSIKTTFDLMVKGTDEGNASIDQIDADTKCTGDLGAEIVAMNDSEKGPDHILLCSIVSHNPSCCDECLCLI